MRFGTPMCIAAAAVIFSLVQLSAIDQPVRIIEQEMRSNILEREIELTVPVSNLSGESVSGILCLELLDPNDWVLSSSDIKTVLKPGRNSISTRLSNDYAFDSMFGFRIRYSFHIDANPISHGVVSLVAISPSVFEITTAAPTDAFPGKPYRVRVHASNPVTHQPVSGVQVSGWIGVEDTDENEESSAIIRTTDGSGDAILPFIYPKDAEDEIEVRIEARLGDQVRNSKIGIPSRSDARKVRFAITTDKPLYQPGQSFHARVLMLQADRQVVSNESVRFELLDPDSERILSGTGTTNEFGIASIDWDLAETLQMGEYELQVSISKESDYNIPEAIQKIRISRYDLPNFAVTAKPDRAYYLPGQDASIKISAKYLFDKELAAGSVKLVRVGGEDESECQTAELDKSGESSIRIDLSEFHAQLTREEAPGFLDLTYAASVTDPTSGKTERRQFDLRVSRAAIHIYISNKSVIGNRASFYLSTYYPDGKPAECQIRIKEDPNYNRANFGDSSSTAYQLLARTKTNSYGVAKISDLGLLARADNHRLLLDVRDRNELNSQFEVILDDKSQSLFQLATDKTIYRSGESIIVSTQTSESVSGRIAVDVTRNGIVLWNGGIRLHDHRGFAIVPYLAEFKGEVTITAYPLDHQSGYYSAPPYVNRTVFFPDPSALKLSISTDRGSYRPGDVLSAVIHTSTVSGAPVKSALGAVIIDRALQERAQSEQRWGSERFESPDWSWFYSTGSIGGVSRRSLAELDLTRPLPDGLDLAAEILLSVYDAGYVPRTENSNHSYRIGFKFLDKMRKDLAPVRAALLNQDEMSVEFATNSREVATILKKAGIDIQTVRDSWDMPYQYRFSVDQRLRKIIILSTGPDKKLDTMDDINVEFLEWNYFLPYGKLIDRVVKEAHATSGLFIKDLKALSAALVRHGLDLNSLRDPWGNPYQFTFEVNGPSYDINGYSKGPVNGCCQFSVWSSSIDYFESTRSSIAEALDQNLRTHYTYPMEEESFDRIVSDSGIQFRRLLDPWGHAYYVKLSHEPDSPEPYGQFADKKIQKAPSVTGKLAWIRIYGSGADGKPGTGDDFLVAGYSKDIRIQSGKDFVAQPMPAEAGSKTNGDVRITVVDPSGAAVSSAVVLAYMRNGGQQFKASADADGSYLLRSMPAGICDISIFFPSFVITQVRDVEIQAGRLTSIKTEMVLDTTPQTITVTAEVVNLILNSSSSVAVSTASHSIEGTQAQKQEGMFTPRLREYFPETLYWEPSIVTDSFGTARIKLNLADSMTTWKMTVLASTKSGQVEIAEKEIEVFQPFFVEHDPPRVGSPGTELEFAL